MNLNEGAFSAVFSPLFTIKEHFDKVIEKALAASARSGREIRIFTHFLTTIYGLSHNFEELLFKNCEEFQKQTKESVKDDQMTHAYQMVINAVLRFGDNVHKFNKAVGEGKDLLGEIEKQSKVIQNNAINMITSTTSDMKVSIAQFESDYRKYVKAALQPYLPAKDQQLGVSTLDPQNLKSLEDTAQTSFSAVRQQVTNNLNTFQLKLESLNLQENEGKVTARRISNNVSHTVKALNNRDTLGRSDSVIEQNMDKNSFFESLKRDLLLEFNKEFRFAVLQLNFLPGNGFLKLSYILDGPYAKYLSQKTRDLAPKIPVRIRIYIELFFDYFYRKNEELTKEMIEELQLIFAEKQTRDYFVSQLLLKKGVIFQAKPVAQISLKSTQFQNLELIAQSLLLACLKDPTDIDFETVFTFLKFALTVSNEQKQVLIERCSRMSNFGFQEFWTDLYDFAATKNLNGLIEYKVAAAPPENKFLTGLKNMVDNLTGQPKAPREEVRLRAFEEVAILMFRLGLKFEMIADVLLTISASAEVSPDTVKAMLMRNQDLLVHQISSQPEFRIDTLPIFDKLTKYPTRNHKISFVLPKLVGYITSYPEIRNMMFLNRFIYERSQGILKEVLLQFTFPRNSKVRQHIIALKIDPKNAVEFLIDPIDVKDDSIISLDVKRTTSFDKRFKPESLRRILVNISSEEVGSFAYYQGLNYITTYFLTLMDHNEVKTYNLLISILYANFSPFVDQELKNIKKLFFYLKSFMATHLPALHHFLETEQKLNADILLASWCLALFTQVTQYVEYSPYLDEIVDIFLSKGWPGFFRVILVILDEMQEKIFKLNYEDTLMMLSEICKTNFREVVAPKPNLEETMNESLLDAQGKPLPTFSFKKKIQKFKKVNRFLMICYQCQYHKMEEKMEEFWHKTNKRLKLAERKGASEKDAKDENK